MSGCEGLVRLVAIGFLKGFLSAAKENSTDLGIVVVLGPGPHMNGPLSQFYSLKQMRGGLSEGSTGLEKRQENGPGLRLPKIVRK